MGFVLNLNFNAKNLSLMVSGTLVCIHMLMCVYEYMKLGYAYTDLEHVYANTCLRMHALGFLWPSFQKIVLFSS